MHHLHIEIKRLVKGGKSIEVKLRRQAKRYNKTYLGGNTTIPNVYLYLKTKPNKRGESIYLSVSIDDFSQELYAGIYSQ
ncbi:hypothetical protein [Gilliamella sp. ESL0232]|uniref:hypothetical protein n=1 Tax=unclassified Gilliamella TaxID=2685620 RepID=UPI0015809467|nr:hypothetical protein [Gilliamella sp. ESL0232]NUE96147.1 hypothetical protein [Gilliamella sp. ESL0232]